MRSFLSLSLLVLATPLPAQLAGTYTVNPAQPTGGKIFKSFTDLGTALGSQTVVAPVIVRVVSGTYTESFRLPIAAGTSATNTVTIQSLVPLPGQVKLRGASTHTMELVGSTASSSPSVAHYVFERLTFESAPSGHAIYSNSYIDSVEIRNCSFEAGHSQRLLYLQQRYKDWKIHHNKFVVPGGNGYGLYMSQIYQSEIHHNEVDLNGGYRGMFFINYNDAQNRVYNNWFYGNLANNGDALNMGASNYNNHVHNNTFVVNALGSNAAAIYSQGFTPSNRANRFHDNVVVVLGGGICFEQYSASQNLSPFIADNNIYFAPGGAIGKDLNNTRHTTIASWTAATGQDKSSKVVNPQCLSIQAPYDLRIAASSPAVDSAAYSPSWIVDDFHGERRGGKADIGADEVVVRGFGSSCAGTGNVSPELSSSGYWYPGTGSFRAELTQAPGSAPAVLFFAFSNTTWGPVNLPIPLPGGCSGLTSMDLSFGALADAQGAASFPLSIPDLPGLMGLSFYTQVLVVDSGATLGFTLTNGMQLDI